MVGKTEKQLRNGGRGRQEACPTEVQHTENSPNPLPLGSMDTMQDAGISPNKHLKLSLQLSPHLSTKYKKHIEKKKDFFSCLKCGKCHSQKQTYHHANVSSATGSVYVGKLLPKPQPSTFRHSVGLPLNRR